MTKKVAEIVSCDVLAAQYLQVSTFVPSHSRHRRRHPFVTAVLAWNGYYPFSPRNALNYLPIKYLPTLL